MSNDRVDVSIFLGFENEDTTRNRGKIYLHIQCIRNDFFIARAMNLFRTVNNLEERVAAEFSRLSFLRQKKKCKRKMQYPNYRVPLRILRHIIIVIFI